MRGDDDGKARDPVGFWETVVEIDDFLRHLRQGGLFRDQGAHQRTAAKDAEISVLPDHQVDRQPGASGRGEEILQTAVQIGLERDVVIDVVETETAQPGDQRIRVGVIVDGHQLRMERHAGQGKRNGGGPELLRPFPHGFGIGFPAGVEVAGFDFA